MDINVGIKDFKRGTNINDIKVPAKLRERKKTGLSWFDEAFGGEGLVPSTIHMITGAPGAGKSTLLRQLGDSLTKSGYICLMNTGEESLYQVKMASERLKLKHACIGGQDKYVDDLVAYAKGLQKQNPTKQVFVLQDSLQTLDDGFYANGTTGNTPVRCAAALTEWAKETFGIVMFIGQVNKDGEFSGKNTIKHMVDGHAELYFDTDKKSETFGKRLFEVSKNRWGCNGKTFIMGMCPTGLYEEGYFSKAQDTGNE
jgi:DNA repair protein RadA/Sms